MLTSSDDVAALAVTTTDARLLTSSDDVAALKLRSKSLIHWVSWVCSYWAVRFREVGVLNHLVSLEEFSNDSMWTHCSIVSAYSSASVDHSSHVFTGGEVCFVEDYFDWCSIQSKIVA